jgi:hypothetical protein
MFPVRYELSFYIAEDGILHSDLHENLRSYKKKVYKKNSNQRFSVGPVAMKPKHLGRVQHLWD